MAQDVRAEQALDLLATLDFLRDPDAVSFIVPRRAQKIWVDELRTQMAAGLADGPIPEPPRQAIVRRDVEHGFAAGLAVLESREAGAVALLRDLEMNIPAWRTTPWDRTLRRARAKRFLTEAKKVEPDAICFARLDEAWSIVHNELPDGELNKLGTTLAEDDSDRSTAEEPRPEFGMDEERARTAIAGEEPKFDPVKVIGDLFYELRLAKARKGEALLQADVAREAGISPSALSLWVNGRRTPSYEGLFALGLLARRYGIHNWNPLFGLTSGPPSPKPGARNPAPISSHR
jgi:DNA-binding XRE family transcriptional regulator